MGTMRYELTVSPEAQDDLLRLNDFLMAIDQNAADGAATAIEKAYEFLTRFPHTCRKAQGGDLGPAWREMLVNFGSSGYIALFQITGEKSLTIAAVRHQRESDYH